MSAGRYRQSSAALTRATKGFADLAVERYSKAAVHHALSQANQVYPVAHSWVLVGQHGLVFAALSMRPRQALSDPDGSCIPAFYTRYRRSRNSSRLPSPFNAAALILQQLGAAATQSARGFDNGDPFLESAGRTGRATVTPHEVCRPFGGFGRRLIGFTSARNHIIVGGMENL